VFDALSLSRAREVITRSLSIGSPGLADGSREGQSSYAVCWGPECRLAICRWGRGGWRRTLQGGGWGYYLRSGVGNGDEGCAGATAGEISLIRGEKVTCDVQRTDGAGDTAGGRR
jgi:hypothetical protein